jgi:proline iminopeptidase
LKEATAWLGDPIHRDVAMEALALHGSQGLQALTRWWKSNQKDAVACARVAEGALPFREASRSLYSQLIRNRRGQEGVVEALVRLEPVTTAHPLLIEAIRTLTEDAPRGLAVRTLGERQETRAVGLFRKVLVNGGTQTRAWAARALALTGDRSHNTLLIERLQAEGRHVGDANRGVREAIHWALGTLGGEEVVVPLVASLDHPEDRNSIVMALVRLDALAIGSLATVIKRGDAKRIQGAVSALLEIGEKSAPSLVDALIKRTPAVRAAARDLLIALRAPSTPSDIAALLETQTVDDPSEVLAVLVHYDAEQMVPVLRQALSHANGGIRRAAVEFTGRADIRVMIPLLLELAELESDLAVQREVIKQLHRMGVRDAADALGRLAESPVVDIRVAALMALADLGRTRHVIPIVKAAHDNSPDIVKDAARHALRRISAEDPRAFNSSQWIRWAGAAEQRIRDWGRTAAPVGKGDAVAHDGTLIPYRVAGKAGPVVIVLHDGPDGNSDYLVPRLDPLSQGARIVTYDRRGRDGSEASETFLARYRPAVDIADLEAVRRALKVPQVFLMGHGFGGMVALAYAKSKPEHVLGMMLMNTGIPAAEEWPTLVDLKERLPEPWRGDLEGLLQDRHAHSPAAFAQYSLDLSLIGAVQNRRLLPVLREAVTTSGRAVERLREAWGNYDFRRWLRDTRIPTLVVGARGDIFGEGHIQKLQALVANNDRVRLAVVPGARHYPFIEEPGPTLGLLRNFIAGTR